MLYQLIAECTDYDFKQALEVKKPKSWLKSVSAFANTLGGTLFFGVTNDKAAVGVEDPQGLGEKISQLINERIKPTPIYVVSNFMEDGKAIVTVKVYAGTSTPYYYVADGVQEAYIRSGNESIIAPPHILNELVLKGLNQTYDTLKTNYKKSDYFIKRVTIRLPSSRRPSTTLRGRRLPRVIISRLTSWIRTVI